MAPRSPCAARRHPQRAHLPGARAGAASSDGTKGDLLATVEVQVPAVLDQAARAAVEAYREATADKPLRTRLFEEAG